MEDWEELVGSEDSEDWEELYNKSPYVMGYTDDDDDAGQFYDERETDEDYGKYMAQIEATEGFEVDFYPILPGMIIPAACNEEGDKIALRHYNQSKDSNFEFVKLEKPNVQVVKDSGSKPPPEKRQKMESAEEIEGEQVVSEQMTDVSFLDLCHEFFGKDVHTNDKYYKNYCTQVMNGQGFDVSNFPIMFTGQIMPLNTSDCSLNLVHVFAELALSLRDTRGHDIRNCNFGVFGD